MNNFGALDLKINVYIWTCIKPLKTTQEYDWCIFIHTTTHPHKKVYIYDILYSVYFLLSVYFNKSKKRNILNSNNILKNKVFVMFWQITFFNTSKTIFFFLGGVYISKSLFYKLKRKKSPANHKWTRESISYFLSVFFSHSFSLFYFIYLSVQRFSLLLRAAKILTLAKPSFKLINLFAHKVNRF